MQPLFSDRIVALSGRRLGILGVSDRQRERGLRAARKAIANGPLPRSEVVEAAARAGFPVSVETRTHLAVLLVAEGTACIGPDSGRQSVFVAAEDWLGPQRSPDRGDALAELARHYVGAFAPTTEHDFSYWSGLPLRDCRAGLKRIARELDDVQIGGETMVVPRGWTARRPRSPVVRLLGAFDTYLMGYASRHHATEEWEGRILPGGGVLRPTICVDGQLVGLWGSKRSGNRMLIDIEPFEPLADDVLAALADEARDLGRFEGVEAELA
jgi:hypothetical protein